MTRSRRLLAGVTVLAGAMLATPSLYAGEVFYAEGFEEGDGGWTGGGTERRSTAIMYSGRASLEQTSGSQGNADMLRVTLNRPLPTLGPDEKFANFRFTVQVYDGVVEIRNGETTGGAAYRLQADVRRSDGRGVSGSPLGSKFRNITGAGKLTLDMTRLVNQPDAATVQTLFVIPFRGGDTPYFIDEVRVRYEVVSESEDADAAEGEADSAGDVAQGVSAPDVNGDVQIAER